MNESDIFGPKKLDIDNVIALRFMDLEKEFKLSIDKYDCGFVIDDSINYHKEFYSTKNPADGLKVLQSKDSIYSYKFGIDTSDDENIVPRMYSCKCGRTFGMDNIGLKCPHCDTIVKRAKDKNVGWFVLKHEKVFNPLLCSFIMNEKYRSKKTGKEETLYTLLSSGELDYSWEDILWKERDGEYSGALFEFANKYLKNKRRDLFRIYPDWKYWFTSYIPVISKNFRFTMITSSNFDGISEVDQHKLNPEYIEISYAVNDLNEKYIELSMIKSRRINKIKEIIKCLSNIVKIVEAEFLDGKKAIIQEQYSRRTNNSGRLIMVPLNDEKYYGVDNCVLSIDYFRSVFRKDVVRVCKEMKIDPKKIKKLTNVDYSLSDEDRHLINNEIFPRIKNKYQYINREPAIYMTSALVMRIVALTDTYTIQVPFFILAAIAGDFDGDIQQCISHENAIDRLRMYETMSPKRRIIDTRLIKWNSKFGPSNNCSILLYKGFNKKGTLEKLT